MLKAEAMWRVHKTINNKLLWYLSLRYSNSRQFSWNSNTIQSNLTVYSFLQLWWLAFNAHWSVKKCWNLHKQKNCRHSFFFWVIWEVTGKFHNRFIFKFLFFRGFARGMSCSTLISCLICPIHPKRKRKVHIVSMKCGLHAGHIASIFKNIKRARISKNVVWSSFLNSIETSETRNLIKFQLELDFSLSLDLTMSNLSYTLKSNECATTMKIFEFIVQFPFHVAA